GGAPNPGGVLDRGGAPDPPGPPDQGGIPNRGGASDPAGPLDLAGAPNRGGVPDPVAAPNRGGIPDPAGPSGLAGAPNRGGVSDPASAPDPDGAEEASLVEALDDPGEPERYPAAGYRRLEALGRELAGLRRRVGQPLPELVAAAERALRLDIELAAGPERGGARVHLDRFLDVAARFAEDAEVATLSAFLAYLEAAEATERGLEAGLVEVNTDRVQVLTVHAAK